VDEADEDLGLIAALLPEPDYTITTLAPGRDAFERIRTEQPNAILCDLQLTSAGHGWALVDLLQEDLATAQIPLVTCVDPSHASQTLVPVLAESVGVMLEKPYKLADVVLALQQTGER
jgi:CheY-like chemotaxis protein